MANPFYNQSGVPATRAFLSSAPLRSEFGTIAAGFDTVNTTMAPLASPLFSGSPSVRVVSTGTNYEAFSLWNNGAGANTRARLSFYGNSTLYGAIQSGYGALSPEMNFVLASSTPGVFTWVDNVTERMRIDAVGNVGVGTASPTYKLHVAGASVGLVNPASADTAVTVANPSSYALFGVDATSPYLAASTLLRVFTGGSERVRVDASGNVGIGVTSPTNNLHVGAASLASIQLNANSTTDIFRVYSGGAGVILLGTTTNTSLVLIAGGASAFSVKANGQVNFVPKASAPPAPAEGDVYYDSTTKRHRGYNGTVWVDFY